MKIIPLCFALPLSVAFAFQGIYVQPDNTDWDMACDNTGTCRAAGYHADYGESDDTLISLLITREAGADGAITAHAHIMPDEKDGQFVDTEGTLHVNGKDLGKLTFPAADSAVLLDDAQTQAVLAALTAESAEKIAKAGGGGISHEQIAALAADNAEIIIKAGGRSMTLSPQGATLVLAIMDEFQERIDTPSALIKKGNSDKAVPDAAAVAQITPVIPKGEAREIAAGSAEHALLMKHFAKDFSEHKDARCDAVEEGAPKTFTLYPLDDKRVLSQTSCWTAAYNQGFHFAVLSADLQQVLEYEYGSGSDDFNLTDYDAGKGQLLSAFRGRGIGDCWSEEIWQFDGKDFVRAFAAEHGMCKGFPGGAWKMPTFVSEIVEETKNSQK